MITETIRQIVENLNTHLGTEYAKVMQPNGEAFGTDGNKIAVNLINIEEDKVFKNHMTRVESQNPNDNSIESIGEEYKMRISLYLIFVFHQGTTPEQYIGALRMLNQVLTYFQATVYQEITVPISLTDNKTVSLAIDYHNISLEDSNNMWSNLGGEQKPYAMYKVSLLELEPTIDTPMDVALQEPPIISSPDYKPVTGETLYASDGSPLNDTNEIKHKKD